MFDWLGRQRMGRNLGNLNEEVTTSLSLPQDKHTWLS
jgi:hypothetical protein